MQKKLIEQLRKEIQAGADREDIHQQHKKNLYNRIETLQTKVWQLEQQGEMVEADVKLIQEKEELVERVNQLENVITILAAGDFDREAMQNTLKTLGFASLDLLYKSVDN